MNNNNNEIYFFPIHLVLKIPISTFEYFSGILSTMIIEVLRMLLSEKFYKNTLVYPDPE